MTLAWSGHYKFIWSVQPTFTALCSADNFFFTVLTSWWSFWPEWTSEPPIFCPQFNAVLTAHVLICSRVLLSIPPQLFNWKRKTLHFLFGRELTLQVDKTRFFQSCAIPTSALRSYFRKLPEHPMLECWGSFGLIFSSLSRLNTAGVHICKGCSSKTQNLMSHTGRVETGAQVCMFSCLFFKRMNRRPLAVSCWRGI